MNQANEMKQWMCCVLVVAMLLCSYAVAGDKAVVLTDDQSSARDVGKDNVPVLIDLAWLEKVRKTFPQDHPALRRLGEQADEVVGAEPPSVTDKRLTPPSGDKHDYMSVAPYFWPDPDQPDGLPYIWKDGEVNPSASDYDAPSLDRMASSVETLTLAWFLLDRDDCAQAAKRFLRTWFLDERTCMNPHLRFAQSIPGRVEGRGIGIVETGSLVRVLDAVRLLTRGNILDQAEQQGLRRWFKAYMSWLIDSRNGRVAFYTIGTNPGTSYDAQVSSYALYVSEEDVARRLFDDIGPRRVDHAIFRDGSQRPELWRGQWRELVRTRSLYYSRINLNHLLNLAAIGRHIDVDMTAYVGEYDQTIEKAVKYLVPHWMGQRRWDYLQLSPEKLSDVYTTLRQAAWIFRDANYAELAERLPETDSGVLVGLPESERAAHRANLLWPDAAELKR